VTLQVLDTLSRYENVADLSEDAISSILVNDALRAKMETVQMPEEQMNIIKDAIIAENKRISQEVDRQKAETDDLKRQLTEKEEIINALSESARDATVQLQSTTKEYEEIKRRLHAIENAQTAEAKYNEDMLQFDGKRQQFINEKMIEYSKKKHHFWTFSIILLALLSLLAYFYYNNATLTSSIIILPSIFFVATLILSFVNRDKVIESFKYHLRHKQVKENKTKEFDQAFRENNMVPKRERR